VVAQAGSHPSDGRRRLGVWLVGATVAFVYGALALAPPTNTEAVFGDAAIALTGEGPRARIAYFADVQDNSLAFSYVIAGLRRLGLASMGLPVATLPSLAGVLAQLVALRIILLRSSSSRQCQWAVLAVVCNPLVMFLGTRAWPDSLASGLVLLGVALVAKGQPPTYRGSTRHLAGMLLMVSACVLKANLVTAVCLAAAMSIGPARVRDVARPRVAMGALAVVVSAVVGWSVFVEQPTLLSVGTHGPEASLIRRISDYMRVDASQVYVTLVRYHAYLALLLIPAILILLAADTSRSPRWPSARIVAVGVVAGGAYWATTRGKVVGELDFGRIISRSATEVLEAVGIAIGVMLVPEMVRRVRRSGDVWAWWTAEGIIVMHSFVRPTQRYLLPVILLGVIAVASIAKDVDAPVLNGGGRSARARQAVVVATLAVSSAWALAGLSFVVAQGRAAERIWREADRRGVVELTGFGPVEVHVGYRASLGDGACFEVVQSGAGDDAMDAVAVAPMRILGYTVREYVLRAVENPRPGCPDVSHSHGG